MADNTTQTSKKSGFSFRKRSESKTRKSEDSKPVDIETGERIKELVPAESGEDSAAERSDVPSSKEVKPEAPEVRTSDGEGATVKTPTSVEDSCLKEVKSDESPEEVTKKSKRRSRILFRKSSKNKDEKSPGKVEEANDDAAKDDETKKKNLEVIEAKESDVCVNDSEEQVARDEPARESEISEQNDAERFGSTSGERSETEGKFGEKSEELDEQGEDSADEAAEDAVSDEKKVKQKKRTKGKSFFKRGFPLGRSKSKKKQQDAYPKEHKLITKKSETYEIGMSTMTNDESSEDKTDEKANNAEVSEERRAEGGQHQNIRAITKKSSGKPVRKVSFVEPQAKSSEGDSPSEEATETTNVFQNAPSTTAETTPCKAPTMASESVREPRDVDDSENPKTEVDDDELTEVSSVTSSFAASSDAPTQTDAEETGSRITLLESDEIDEGSKSKPAVDNKASSKDALEDETLLSDGEWVLLNQSHVSAEFQRMKKQTLSGFKRVCCSMM